MVLDASVLSMTTSAKFRTETAPVAVPLKCTNKENLVGEGQFRMILQSQK